MTFEAHAWLAAADELSMWLSVLLVIGCKSVCFLHGPNAIGGEF